MQPHRSVQVADVAVQSRNALHATARNLTWHISEQADADEEGQSAASQLEGEEVMAHSEATGLGHWQPEPMYAHIFCAQALHGNCSRTTPNHIVWRCRCQAHMLVMCTWLPYRAR